MTKITVKVNDAGLKRRLGQLQQNAGERMGQVMHQLAALSHAQVKQNFETESGPNGA